MATTSSKKINPKKSVVSNINKSYEKNVDDLSNYYSSEKVAQLEMANKSKQEADITYQKLRKYLPLEARANGSNAVGLKEQMELQAGDSYARNIASIDASSRETQRQLNQEELNAKNQLRAQRDQELSAYGERNLSEVQTTIEQIANAYADENGVVSDEGMKHIEEYYYGVDGQAGAQDTIGDNSLEPLLEGYRQTKIADESNPIKSGVTILDGVPTIKNTQRADMSAGDDFEIYMGNDKYKVESKGEVSDSGVVKAASYVDEQTPFLFENEVYIKVGGKTYRLGVRSGWGDDKGYNNLKKRLQDLAQK